MKTALLECPETEDIVGVSNCLLYHKIQCIQVSIRINVRHQKCEVLTENKSVMLVPEQHLQLTHKLASYIIKG